MTFISKQPFRDISKRADQKQITNLEKTRDKIAYAYKFTRVAKNISAATSI